jgi:hypothetical protein
MNLETQFDGFDKRKGQSAIEYLMTYGWMLLVVAIVGGAIFATVQGQCQQATSGFSGTDVRIDDFGVDSSGALQMQLRNGASDPVNVTSVTVENVDGVGSAYSLQSAFVDMGVGATDSATVGGADAFEQVDGCNTFDVTITYDVTGGLSDQQITGTLTDSIQAQ